MQHAEGGGTWLGRGSIAVIIAGCALVLLSDAGGGGTATPTCARDQPGQIRLVGHAPKPVTIRVSPGSTVTWVACGRGSRRVASDSRAWPAFTLRQGGVHRTTLDRVGRYRYRVDGKGTGTIVVAATTPTRSTGAERTARYDIRVEARYTYRQTDGGGQVETTFAYAGTWRNVPVKIYDAYGTVSVVMTGARGTIDATLAFADGQGDTRCRGTLDYPAYPAVADLSGSVGPGRAAVVAFSSTVADSGPYSRLTDERTAACDDLPASDARTVWLGGPFPSEHGVTVEPPGAGVGEMDAGFRRAGGKGVPYPLDRLRAGKGFEIRGARTIGPQPCGTGCTESSTGRVAFLFTPRR